MTWPRNDIGQDNLSFLPSFLRLKVILEHDADIMVEIFAPALRTAVGADIALYHIEFLKDVLCCECKFCLVLEEFHADKRIPHDSVAIHIG